jgi:hydroxymethylbilane synthase
VSKAAGSAIRIGSRGSALALAQAGAVAAAIEAIESADVQVEVVPIKTAGDVRGGGDKSRFVKEIEKALLQREVDLAVHSAKDVPAALPEGLELVGAPLAEDARDALVGARSLEELPSGARVGTSSLRRRSQLLALRGDLEIVALRGNVDTRLAALDAGRYDAIVLAIAGLRRLGRVTEAVTVLSIEEIVPAPGQGILALEARADDERARSLAGALSDEGTLVRLAAERALVRALDASCHTPIGANARLSGAGESGRIEIEAYVGLPDGREWIRDRHAVSGGGREAAGEAGREMARRLVGAGAADLLRAADAAASD